MYEAVRQIVESTSFKLLEALAEKISLQKAGIRGIFCGGTEMTPQFHRWVREEVLADFGPGHDAMRISPDGAKVAFHSNRGGKTLNVWVADLPAGTPRQVTFDSEMAGFPCWSPDGGTLAFEAKREGDVQVFTVPATGGTAVQLTRGTGQNWPYSFSPDGSMIAFAGRYKRFRKLGWVTRFT